MQIHGLNKTTLLDYPGIVASTIFTGYCNFRCPFCQNSDLVLDPLSQPILCEEEIFAHLDRRKGIVKGVCITGGEPTLNSDLLEFMGKLKERDLLVKLDTNGYNPAVLKEACKEGLTDYVAMDIKSSIKRYDEASGIKTDTSKIMESVEFLINSGMDYEFRTTVVKSLHDEETFRDIATLIKGAKGYYLQGFVDSERVMCPGLLAYTFEELKSFLPIFEGLVENVSIRGVE